MIRAFFTGLAAIIAFSWTSPLQVALGQEESDQRLGTVHFPTSCNETAQRRFDRGMRYQHSFWYRESRGIFEDVIKADPGCGIAYWGIALSYLDNPHNPPPQANLPLGMAAIQKAKAIGNRGKFPGQMCRYDGVDRISSGTGGIEGPDIPRRDPRNS